MLQECPCYKNISPHLLGLPFSTPFSLISLPKFWNKLLPSLVSGVRQSFFYTTAIWNMYCSFGKIQGDAQKAIITQFIQDDSELQVLYLCFVFEKFTSEKTASKCHVVIFSPKKHKLWGLPVNKYWNLESAFPKGLLEHIRVLLTLIRPSVLAFTDISMSLVTWDLFSF